jgi:hypothetical protein
MIGAASLTKPFSNITPAQKCGASINIFFDGPSLRAVVTAPEIILKPYRFLAATPLIPLQTLPVFLL